jgi:4,5-dihydroxyphthalate decarboxylase
MSKLRLTFACWNYDRTRALADGTVQPDGIDLNYLNLPVEETFFRMARYREFDVAEMSLSSYSVSLCKDNPPFIAIPVFPSRSFRHNGIFISTKSSIREPKDLIGKKVGSPEYQLTAPVWVRGIMADEFGVPIDAPQYYTGGQEQTGRIEKITLNLPPNFKLRPIGPTQTLSQMLADGELDAVYSPRTPSTFRSRPKDVRRLFENFQEVERAYFAKTKIFPIMHTVAIRREVYKANPWVAQSLYKAFIESQRLVYEDMMETAALKFMLPWLAAHVEELNKHLGKDWWSYGFEPNKHVIDTFLRYHHEQGLSTRRLKAEELFAPETFESFKI